MSFMKAGSAPAEIPVESRPARIARAITWIGLLAAAAGFWMTAGWLVLGYLRPVSGEKGTAEDAEGRWKRGMEAEA